MTDTALPTNVRTQIEEIGTADIVVGIPSYQNAATIAYVTEIIGQGLGQYFPNMKAVIINSDGGSSDNTCDVCLAAPTSAEIPKLAFTYEGLPGKGSAMRAIFEATTMLGAKACVVVDADLRSIVPEWIDLLAGPVVKSGHDYVAPFYVRHKYDGTITNNLAYPLTRALYGYDIRQPIGGDFGLSGKMAKIYVSKDVWQSDVARFGIDIWMTTTAITETRNVAQARLGAKIHDPKDPAAALGPMFAQVVGTCFSLMKPNVSEWFNVTGSQPTPIYGPEIKVEPEPVNVSLDALLEKFRTGMERYRPEIFGILMDENMNAADAVLRQPHGSFWFPVEDWVRIVYDFAVAYNLAANEGERGRIIEALIPLYYGRTASLVVETRDMSSDEAERVVQEQALTFEAYKPYLVNRWDPAFNRP